MNDTLEWRSMDSAPMDGTPVLVVDNYLDRMDNPEVVIARYGAPPDGEITGECWWSGNGSGHYGSCDIVYPTHWMPLPCLP